MQLTKQPLITIEGKDCEEYPCICSCPQCELELHSNCNFKCKAKSPTKLIFDANNFKDEELPKKEDIININCDRDYVIEDKKFRLSSDAVLKSVGEMPTMDENEGGEMMSEHNLSESSKIVIAEGYYE